jgi:uncharacterized protein (TIGR04255 family)
VRQVVPSDNAANGPPRPIAPGFAAAPAVESLMAIHFAGGLSDSERSEISTSAAKTYSKIVEQVDFSVNIDGDVGAVETSKRAFYRLEGADPTEILLVRPEGLIVSKLAPYRSWEDLMVRFRSNIDSASDVIGWRQPTALAVRNINRIDVPFIDGTARYEDYLNTYVRVPESIPSITNFGARFNIDVGAAKSVALVQTHVMAPQVPGFLSVILDIEITRQTDFGNNYKDVYQVLEQLRAPKNELYRTLLTQKALQEFEK